MLQRTGHAWQQIRQQKNYLSFIVTSTTKKAVALACLLLSIFPEETFMSPSCQPPHAGGDCLWQAYSCVAPWPHPVSGVCSWTTGKCQLPWPVPGGGLSVGHSMRFAGADT